MPLPTLVLIHGLFSTPLEFSLQSRILEARSVPFDYLEVPGYTGPGRRDDIDWHDWVRAAGAALDAKYGVGQPIVLGGLCVGSAIAAALVAGPRQQRVMGLALLSPTFSFDGWSITRWHRCRGLAYALRFDRWLTFREKEPFGIKNTKTRAWIQQELAERKASAIGPASLPLRGIREAERLYAFVASRIATLDVPMLVLHSREDEIATLASVERVMADAQPGNVKLVALEHSFHMITLDNDRQRVAHEIADFVGAEKLVRAAPVTKRNPTVRHPASRQRPGNAGTRPMTSSPHADDGDGHEHLR